MDKKIEKKPWYANKAYNLILAGSALSGITYCFMFSGNTSVLKIANERLSISTVREGDFQEYVPVDGIVSPGETVYLDIIQGGMVEKIYVEDGVEVRKGDTLAKLSNSNLELEYINRETQMFDILNNLQSSKATLERNRIELQKQLTELDFKIDICRKKRDMNMELLKAGAVSENENTETRREYDYLLNQRTIALRGYQSDSLFISSQTGTLNSGIIRMRDNLSAIHKILDQLYIIAPLNGQLSSLNATPGELKKPGDKLGQIDVQDYYKIRATIDERYAARVYAGQEAATEYMGKNYPLKVSQILPEIKEGVFTINLLFMDTVPSGIKRGQTLPVRMKFGGSTKALMIAKGAFYQSTGGNWVYVVDGSRKATKRNIRIGRQNADAYEVLEGLSAGEKVITSSYKAFNNIDQLILSN